MTSWGDLLRRGFGHFWWCLEKMFWGWFWGSAGRCPEDVLRMFSDDDVLHICKEDLLQMSRRCAEDVFRWWCFAHLQGRSPADVQKMSWGCLLMMIFWTSARKIFCRSPEDVQRMSGRCLEEVLLGAHRYLGLCRELIYWIFSAHYELPPPIPPFHFQQIVGVVIHSLTLSTHSFPVPKRKHDVGW